MLPGAASAHGGLVQRDERRQAEAGSRVYLPHVTKPAAEMQLTLKLQGPDIPYAKNKLPLKTKRYGIYNGIILFIG